jgi:hypothetical protein
MRCDGVSLDEMMILARKILREYLIFVLYIVFYVIVTCEFNVDEVERDVFVFKFSFCSSFASISRTHLTYVYLMSI